jgi:hypothetical protein
MFGSTAAAGDFTTDQVSLIAEAAASSGLPPPRWKRDHAEFTLKDGRRPVPFVSLRRYLARLPEQRPSIPAAILLCDLLAVAPPAALLTDLTALRDMLRPRLLHPRELAGPRRNMCRREVLGDLLLAVSIGGGRNAALVTTPILDAWKAEFPSLMGAACANLSRIFSTENLHEVTSAPGVLALIHRDEQAAAGAFILNTLFPPEFAVEGVLFSTPREDVLLTLPVSPGAGPGGLAALVQATFTMAHERAEPLSDRVYWWRKDGALYLPMTTVEHGRSRRIHLEAQGPMEHLLRILGAIE